MSGPALGRLQLLFRHEKISAIAENQPGRPAQRETQYMMVAPAQEPSVPATMTPHRLKFPVT